MGATVDDIAAQIHLRVEAGADLEEVVATLLHNEVRQLDLLASILLYCNQQADTVGDGWSATANKVRAALSTGLFDQSGSD